MGLLYPFPVSKDETDFCIESTDQYGARRMLVKTYGLPYVFWFYAFCCFIVIGFMIMAIKAPILKLIMLGDDIDAMLGYSLFIFLGLLPLSILAFFFFQKNIETQKGLIKITYRLFYLPVFSEKYEISADDLIVRHHLDSPNVARRISDEAHKQFENKGYFVLNLKIKNKEITIDRHSRKADLEKLKSLLCSGLE